MSLRRQPPCVELKDGKPEVKVEMLNASMSNHFTWIVAITNILQSKGLWEGSPSMWIHTWLLPPRPLWMKPTQQGRPKRQRHCSKQWLLENRRTSSCTGEGCRCGARAADIECHQEGSATHHQEEDFLDTIDAAVLKRQIRTSLNLPTSSGASTCTSL